MSSSNRKRLNSQERQVALEEATVTGLLSTLNEDAQEDVLMEEMKVNIEFKILYTMKVGGLHFSLCFSLLQLKSFTMKFVIIQQLFLVASTLPSILFIFGEKSNNNCF